MNIKNIIRKLQPITSCNSSKPYDKEFKKDRPIYGFYHVYMVNDWYSLVAEQMNSLVSSELACITDKLFVSCVYEDTADIEQFKSLVPPPLTGKVYIVRKLSKKENEFEFPALENIRWRAEQEEFYAYYFHTKGVSYTVDRLDNYPANRLKQLRDCSNAWRHMMEYFIFYKHNMAINALRDYDTYGCKFDGPVCPPHNYRYYAGNFWWSKSEYLKTLPVLSKEDKRNRYNAETWVLLNTYKVFSPFNTPVELYAVMIPLSLYRNDQKTKLMDVFIFTIRHYAFLLKKAIRKI